MIGRRSRAALVLLLAVGLAASILSACGSEAATGSDQFRGQTSSHLLDFGEEGSEEELEEGTAAVEGFLNAEAEEDWPRVCAELSHSMLSKIEHLAISGTELEDRSCASFLEAFARIPAKELRESKVVDTGSLRHQGQRGFLIYYGADDVVYAISLSREDDTWKVASLSPDRLN